MKVKKANAYCGLLTILLLLVHAVYELFAYITFYYNPFMTKLLAVLILLALLAHIILAMGIVMFAHDSSELIRYPRQNRRTIVQRVSAVAILVLLFGHLYAFRIFSTHAPGSLAGVCVIQTLFFASVYLHVATSFSNALVTIGVLQSMETKKKIDRVMDILCGVAIPVTSVVICRTLILMAGM